MHEDLLGYLLGALEPHEMQRVSQLLRDDPAAREQLAELERSLRPLEEGFQAVEPPPADLVSRTLASLPPLPPPSDSDEVGHSDEVDNRDGQQSEHAAFAEHAFSGDAPVSATLVPMQGGIDAPRTSSVTWMDWIGGATAAAVILGLLLPALAQGRFESRKTACQDQLRQFGTAITQFVNRNQQERLPAVSESGPEAFAGMYAVRLHEAGLIDDPSIRWCPSLDEPSNDQNTLTRVDEIATVADLHDASVDRLRQIQQVVGGHYAYTLGVIEEEQLTPPRFESRSSFAVMADAPMAGISDREDLTKRIGHGATGINVLFEDGRVRFIPLTSLDSMPDHPLLNHRGDVEAGVNIDDASLAPSWRPPFLGVRQR